MQDLSNRSARPGGGKTRLVQSADLFGAQKILLIAHGHEEYRLQITATGKLLLTK